MLGGLSSALCWIYCGNCQNKSEMFAQHWSSRAFAFDSPVACAVVSALLESVILSWFLLNCDVFRILDVSLHCGLRRDLNKTDSTDVCSRYHGTARSGFLSKCSLLRRQASENYIDLTRFDHRADTTLTPTSMPTLKLVRVPLTSTLAAYLTHMQT